MIDWMQARLEALGAPFVARYPNLYLLRVHLMLPLIALLTILALATGYLTPITLANAPLASEWIAIAAFGAFGIGLAWLFLVVRDSQRFLPDRGLKMLGTAALASGVVLGLSLPPTAYAFSVQARVKEFATEHDLATLHENLRKLVALGHELEGLAAAPIKPQLEAQLFVEDRQRAYENLLNRITTHLHKPGMLPDGAPPFECARPSWDEIELFASDCLGELTISLAAPSLKGTLLREGAYSAATLMGLTLALFFANYPNTLRFALVTLGSSVAYSYALVMTCNLLNISGRELALVFLAHWVGLVLATLLQWLRGLSGIVARATGTALALLTPCLAAMLNAAEVQPVYDAQTMATTLTPRGLLASGILYALCLPLVYGNLVRLRYLPRA